MATVTRYHVAGQEFEDKTAAAAAARDANRDLAIAHHRALAHVAAQRAQLPEDLTDFYGDRLAPEDVIPDPVAPEPIEPVEVRYEKVYDVVSSRDGERVVIGVTNRRLARDEADRLNGEIAGDRVRRVTIGSVDANNPLEPTHDVEIPPAPTALNATIVVPTGDGEETEQPQHLTLAPMTEYMVEGPRLQPVAGEEDRTA